MLVINLEEANHWTHLPYGTTRGRTAFASRCESLVLWRTTGLIYRRDPNWQKSICNIGKSNLEKIMSYNDILWYLQHNVRDSQEETVWKHRCIARHEDNSLGMAQHTKDFSTTS